jgi:hypothetical protein
MSCANPGWGSPRIVGEMRKLGIEVAKSTVENISHPPEQTVVSDMEGVSRSPSHQPRVHRFLHRADGALQAAFWPGRSGA